MTHVNPSPPLPPEARPSRFATREHLEDALTSVTATVGSASQGAVTTGPRMTANLARPPRVG